MKELSCWLMLDTAGTPRNFFFSFSSLFSLSLLKLKLLPFLPIVSGSDHGSSQAQLGREDPPFLDHNRQMFLGLSDI